MPKIEDLRKVLVKSKARWSVNPQLHDGSEIPHYATGGSLEGLKLVAEVEAIDFKKTLGFHRWVRHVSAWFKGVRGKEINLRFARSRWTSRSPSNVE